MTVVEKSWDDRMSRVAWQQKDKEELKALFTKARAEGLWFFSRYQQLWFSPDELEKENLNGKFIWGAINWELRDPEEYLEKVAEKLKNTVNEYSQLAERLSMPFKMALDLQAGRKLAEKLKEG